MNGNRPSDDAAQLAHRVSDSVQVVSAQTAARASSVRARVRVRLEWTHSAARDTDVWS